VKHRYSMVPTRTVWLLALLVVGALLFTACAAPVAPVPSEEAGSAEASPAEETVPAEEAAAETTADPYVTVFGEKLPDDAVPYEDQVVRLAWDSSRNATTFDLFTAVYQRYCESGKFSDLFGDPLVDLDKDFNVSPAAAKSWEVSDDGRTWTFHLGPGQMWSDGTPLTAYDYEATFRYGADPEHAWDFAWFFSFLGPGGIKNWSKVVAGELPVEDLGVRAVDDLTLEVETEEPFPPLPSVMLYSFVLQKKALEEYGGYYNSDPATHVSAGPFTLAEFEPGSFIAIEANDQYKGYRQPRLRRIECVLMSPETMFAAYQNHEVDIISYEWLTPADFDIILSDPILTENYLRHFGDFRTDYLMFDTFNPPFDDLNVRKAFAHAVDRDAIVENVFTPIKAMPAHSMLMPGFPSSDTEGKLADYQAYDCDMAKQYLADAGYPDGEGFPKLEMWLRAEGPAMAAVYQATAASIADCLNIEIEVSNKDYKVFTDAMNVRPTELQLGAISYGMDFLDPANLLGIWVSTGRHSWKNDEFDKLVSEASGMIGDPQTRDQLFRDAERILVDDVGGVFIAHRWLGDLVSPNLMGDSIREPDSNGITGFHWGNESNIGNIYIAKEE
jgi:ABC-type transport system substrate-binding protein